jgi:transmembrane sensor
MTDHHPPTGPRAPLADDASPDWEALARYLAGESPPDEARAMAAWLAAHPADAAMLGALDAAVGRAAHADAAPDVDVEAALRRVTVRRDREREGGASSVRPLRRLAPRRLAPRWRVGAMAAAAAALLAVGLVGRTLTSRASDDGGAAPQTYAAEMGGLRSLRLPDGTRVVLAPGSRLLVATDFGSARRDVTLDGAAWFRVRHDAARPFTVRAGPAVVRDLGTAFTVRTDEGGDGRGVAVGVAVTEGAVALRAATAAAPGDTGVVLNAGDRGVLRADGGVIAARGAVTEDDLAWTRGRLVYRAAPLDEVRADLRRWYGIELVVADTALARRRLTATFAGDSARRVLEVIALALGARVELAGDTAVLRPAATPDVAPGGGAPR